MARALPNDSDTTADGRTLRRERNRERIVEAVIELVGEGKLMPTAAEVARRAEVGTRTVFRHFDDMESLHAEVSARVSAELRPLMVAPPAKGSLEARARDFVRARAAIFERLAPYKRSGNLFRWNSPFLQKQHAALVRTLRADLLRALPELESGSAPVLEAVDLVSSFEAWDRLRQDQRLGRERAIEAMEAALLGLLSSR